MNSPSTLLQYSYCSSSFRISHTTNWRLAVKIMAREQDNQTTDFCIFDKLWFDSYRVVESKDIFITKQPQVSLMHFNMSTLFLQVDEHGSLKTYIFPL